MFAHLIHRRICSILPTFVRMLMHSNKIKLIAYGMAAYFHAKLMKIYGIHAEFRHKYVF